MKLYSYSKCGTCRKAKKFLDERGISYQEIDITENPPPKTVLKRGMEEKGLKKLFNTSGVQYKELKIKDRISSMSKAEALDLLAGNGRLIKRPIAVDASKITIGFDADEYERTWAG